MTHPRDPHRGGCFFCEHLERAVDGRIDPRWRCIHPGFPLPTPWHSARDDVERCGPHGRWWDPRLELTPPEDRPL